MKEQYNDQNYRVSQFVDKKETRIVFLNELLR